MTSKRIALSSGTLVQSKATTAYPAPAVFGMDVATVELLRCALSGIPSDATISSTKVQVYLRDAWSGSRTVSAQLLTGNWSTKTTWNTRPTSTATGAVSVSKTGAAAGTLWEFDVTTWAQQWLTGGLANFGVQLVSSETAANRGAFQGPSSGSATLRPMLAVEYLVGPATVTNLHPSSGAVGVTKPVLTGNAPADTIAIQAQVDASQNGTSPTFDSGEVASSAFYFDLSTSSYGGITSGSTSWRGRAKNAKGWGDWSPWATFPYVPYGSIAFTSPGTSSEDPSPPVAGTITPESGASVTGFRVTTLDGSGKTVESSGLQASTGSFAFGPTQAYATAKVEAFTSTVRDATPTDPGTLTATRTFTVLPSGTPTAFSSVAASNNGVSPVVAITGTRSSIPDEVAVYRRSASDTSLGTLVVRGPGTTYMSGTNLSLPDLSAPMNQAWVWDVYAITGGTSWSNKATTAAATPTCSGVWLFDPTDGSQVALADVADAGQERTEQAVEHLTVTGKIIRRRFARNPLTGSLDDFKLVDGMGTTADASYATLQRWALQDAGRVYRLVLGNLNLPVILGNLDTKETPENRPGQRYLNVAGDWWVVT